MQTETLHEGPYETLSHERPYDMLSSEKKPSVKTEHGAESASHTHPRFRIDRATRKCTKRLNVLSEGELRVLDAMAKWLGYGWAPRIAKDEVRLSSSVIAECARMSRSRVIVARAALVAKDILVQTSPAVEGQYIPATYRVAINVLEDLLAKAGAPDSMAMTHQAKRDQDEPPVSEGYTGQSPTGTTPSLRQGQPLVSDRDTLSTSMRIGVGSPVGERAASAALPYGQSLPGGEETPEQGAALVATEELESPVHLVTTDQEGPTGSPGPRVPGRLSAGAHSAWVPEEAESGVRPKKAKKSHGKKTPKPAPASSAGSSGAEVPPARPETSPQSPAREAPPVAPVALPDRTREATPRAAPVPVPGDAHPRTPPEHPSNTLAKTIRLAWSGDMSGGVPHTMTAAEQDFVARFTVAEKAVRYASFGFQTERLDGEALATFCARTFAANFPRGYSVELAEFLDSRTRTLKAAHAIHEAAEARRRAREAEEEEALAERAHKKKKSA